MVIMRSEVVVFVWTPAVLDRSPVYSLPIICYMPCKSLCAGMNISWFVKWNLSPSALIPIPNERRAITVRKKLVVDIIIKAVTVRLVTLNVALCNLKGTWREFRPFL